ncbi:DUF4274 domain-containing protein [Pseudooctadecabacter jejudonensis]|uniref:DUF4274 domain-containing protein n=1 Tax=Pseudooctadecabacter jejudonensis TaxID=1391910 RepID=A0A1Y5RPJ5_9RHOB|nr:DUF4274 domain-containing protein [Pseudooctadecabacter jejudonensis]SLN22070.1 hypothetical protein PSJ8397_00873 [Pseudooctadecabacter jejudonensis]
MASGVWTSIFGKRKTEMPRWEAEMMYSGDPDIVVAQGSDVIPWLSQQGPETWHVVATGWNYGYGVDPLRWILTQQACDRGTAAQVFLVEGMGHWLWDVRANARVFDDDTHLCRLILDRWDSYGGSAFRPTVPVHENQYRDAKAMQDAPPLADTPLAQILDYQGEGQAVSKYEAMDGKIVQSFDRWLDGKGITPTDEI